MIGRHRGVKWNPDIVPSPSSGSTTPAKQRSIEFLKDFYKGSDIWIIGSASSMDYVDPGFFNNKIAISVNYAYRNFPCDWVVTKDLLQADYEELGPFLITADRKYGMHDLEKHEFIGDQPYFVYQHVHNTNQDESVDYSVIGTEQMFVGVSSITTAMNVAAYMGSANILMCGIDGGTLDGKVQYSNYTINDTEYTVDWYVNWIKGIFNQTSMVRKLIKERYNCNVYSLNPFLGFNLEGHIFK